MRVRGLKLVPVGLPEGKRKSHPVRVRGLKQGVCAFYYYSVRRTRAGAWIETYDQMRKYLQRKVAPRAGAWIETRPEHSETQTLRSHPVRVRGLKPEDINRFVKVWSRTPCGCVD